MKAVMDIYGKTRAQEIFAPYLGVDDQRSLREIGRQEMANAYEELEEFIETRIAKKEGVFLTLEELYKEYRAYYIQNGYYVKNRTRFSKEFKAAIGMESQGRKINGVLTRGYGNLMIAPLTLEGVAI